MIYFILLDSNPESYAKKNAKIDAIKKDYTEIIETSFSEMKIGELFDLIQESGNSTLTGKKCFIVHDFDAYIFESNWKKNIKSLLVLMQKLKPNSYICLERSFIYHIKDFIDTYEFIDIRVRLSKKTGEKLELESIEGGPAKYIVRLCKAPDYSTQWKYIDHDPELTRELLYVNYIKDKNLETDKMAHTADILSILDTIRESSEFYETDRHSLTTMFMTDCVNQSKIRLTEHVITRLTTKKMVPSFHPYIPLRDQIGSLNYSNPFLQQ